MATTTHLVFRSNEEPMNAITVHLLNMWKQADYGLGLRSLWANPNREIFLKDGDFVAKYVRVDHFVRTLSGPIETGRISLLRPIRGPGGFVSPKPPEGKPRLMDIVLLWTAEGECRGVVVDRTSCWGHLERVVDFYDGCLYTDGQDLSLTGPQALELQADIQNVIEVIRSQHFAT